MARVAKETATRSRREPLSRRRVIDAALQIMDAEGLDAVTMRRIGRELGVEAMSLYRHFPGGKEDILEGLTERVMAEFAFPADSGDWTEDARALAREWRRLLGLHPGVMQLLAERHKPLEGLAAFRAMDAALGVLRRSGLDSREASQAFNAIGSYIFGFVMMEQGLMPGRQHHHDHDHEAMGKVLGDAGLHNVVECFPFFEECPSDEQFDFGLDLVIRGLQAAGEARDRTTTGA